LLLAAALLAVSLAGFGQVMNRSQPTGAPAAEQPDAPRQVVTFGHATVDGGLVSIHPFLPGRVAEVFVRDGQAVPAGAPLLRMEDPLGPDRLAEAQAGLDAAQTELKESRSAPERHNVLVEQLRLAIAGAKERVEVLRTTLDRRRELQAMGLGGVGSAEVAIARGELRGAELAQQAEEWKLKLLQFQDPRTEIRLREIKVTAAQARVDQAKAAVQQTTLTAPVAGTVLRIAVRAGDTVAGTPQQPAVEFVPDGPLVVRAEVEQAHAGQVAEGQPVRIEDDSHAGGSWTGRVTYLSGWFARPRSVLQEPLQFNDVRTLECIVALDPGQPKLRINQRVRVYIQTAK
jgi:multidrug resistance efflux pump